MVIRAFALLVLALSAGAAHSQPADLPSLAVFEATVTPAARGTFSRLSLDPGELTRQVEEGLRASRRFNVFERSKLVLGETVDAEQELAYDPSFDKSQRDAAALGKKAKVQFIVYPMVTSVNVDVRRLALEEMPGRYRYTATGAVYVTTKILDTTTAQIAYQVTREFSLAPGNEAGKNASGPNDGALVLANAWHTMSRNVATQITNGAVGTLFPIQVVRAMGGDIFVNRGEGAGLEVGDMLQLFSTGEALIDPVTKETLGDAETLLGDVQVVRVAPRFSVLRATGTLAGQAKTGDIARPAAKP